MGVIRKAFYIGLIAVGLYFFNKYNDGCTCDPSYRIDGKVAIVTGANSGLGKATTEELANRGGKIYMACRSIERGEKAAEEILSRNPGLNKNNLVVLQLNLASFASVREFVREFSRRESELNILVNNAAAHLLPEDSKTEDGFQASIGINYFGPFLLTNLLAKKLIAGAPSRVVSVSSDKTGFAPDNIQMQDLQNEKKTLGFMAWEMHCKMCVECYTAEFGRRLKGTGVTTYALHPGQIFTDGVRGLIGNEFIADILIKVMPYIMKSMADGAQTQVCCAVDPKLSNQSGKYYQDCEETEPYPAIVYDETVAKELWDTTTKLLKLNDKDFHPKILQ